MVFLKSIKKALLVMSVAYICSGLLLVMDKEKILVLSLQVFSAGLVLCGLLSIFRYFLIDVRERVKREDFIMGSLLIAIGVVAFLLSQEKLLENYIFYFYGMAMFVSAFIKIQDMFNTSATGTKRFGFYLALFLICAAFGAIVMFSPSIDKTTEYVVIGIGLMFAGATDILSNFLLAGAIHSYDKSLKNENKFIDNARPAPRFEEHVSVADMVEPKEEEKEETKESSNDDINDEEKPLE